MKDTAHIITLVPHRSVPKNLWKKIDGQHMIQEVCLDLSEVNHLNSQDVQNIIYLLHHCEDSGLSFKITNLSLNTIKTLLYSSLEFIEFIEFSEFRSHRNSVK